MLADRTFPVALGMPFRRGDPLIEAVDRGSDEVQLGYGDALGLLVEGVGAVLTVIGHAFRLPGVPAAHASKGLG